MTQQAVKTAVRPKVGKMRKIIKQAAVGKTLVYGNLVVTADDDYDNVGPSLADPNKCANVGRCAMGELLFQIGYKINELRDMDAGGNWDQGVYQDLWSAYRIDKNDVDKIIAGNDSSNDRCEIDGNGPDFGKRVEKLEKVLTTIDVKKNRVDPFLTRLDDSGEPIGPLANKDEIKVLKKFGLYDEYLALDSVDAQY